METKEFSFKETVLNGFLMLFVNIGVLALSVYGIIMSIIMLNDSDGAQGGWLLIGSILLLIFDIVLWCGLNMLEPNEAKVTTWFGKYSGTLTRTGFFWINPFYSTKKVSMRARNLDAEPIKVNDKVGNPVMIGLVLVWKLKDTYKALFEVDTQTMANTPQGQIGTDVRSIMNALERFVRVQSDAALRQVAGQYAYDDEDAKTNELTLRGGGDEIRLRAADKWRRARRLLSRGGRCARGRGGGRPGGVRPRVVRTLLRDAERTFLRLRLLRAGARTSARAAERPPERHAVRGLRVRRRTL